MGSLGTWYSIDMMLYRFSNQSRLCSIIKTSIRIKSKSKHKLLIYGSQYSVGIPNIGGVGNGVGGAVRGVGGTGDI